MNRVTKPPIGIIPWAFFDEITARRIQEEGGVDIGYILEKRILALLGALTRYAKSEYETLDAWANELRYRLRQQKAYYERLGGRKYKKIEFKP